jgi:hypothetical protein
MFKKITMIALTSLILGGCSLNLKTLMGEGAVSDEQQESLATTTPAPTTDPELSTVPSPGTGTDDASIETDIESTTILDEDFSDLNN